MASVTGNTFSTIRAQKAHYEQTDFDQFSTWIISEVEKIQKDRDDYYRSHRDSNATWIRWSPRVLAILGVIGLLATALAAIIRLAGYQVPLFGQDGDKGALVIAMAAYSVMAAILLYERGTSKSTTYFRHLAIGIAVRSLWNKLQIALLKEFPALKAASDPGASRLRLIELVEAFCNDLDKLVAGEQSEWQTGFMDSLKEMETVAANGVQNSKTELKELSDKAADTATKLNDAAARLEAANKPGWINLTVSGEYDGNLAVLLDGTERKRGPGRDFALERIPVGPHIVAVEGSKDGKAVKAEKAIDVTAGILDLAIAL